MRAILSLLAVSMAIAIGFGPLQARAANLIALSEANVSGRYSFRFSGQDLIFGNAHQIAGVGVFVANGRGLISGGSLTYNDGGNVCVFRLPEEGGYYRVFADGEGYLTLRYGKPSNEAGECQFAGIFQFHIALGNVVNGIAQTLELASFRFFWTPDPEHDPHADSRIPASGVAHFQAPLRPRPPYPPVTPPPLTRPHPDHLRAECALNWAPTLEGRIVIPRGAAALGIELIRM